MIKIKTFNIDSEDINDFISEVGIINDGIKVSGDKVVVIYRENKDLEFGEEDAKASVLKSLYEEKQKLQRQEIDLSYFDKFPVDEKTGVRRRQLEEGIEKTKGMIEILEAKLETL